MKSAENKYCIMDDTDVEFNAPIFITDEIKVKDDQVEQMIMEKFSYLFA